MLRPVNSIKPGTIPASRILKPLWRLTCRSSPVLLNDKALSNTRVYLLHMAVQSSHKFGFTQSYDRSYGGIVPVFIEFTARDWRHWEWQCACVGMYFRGCNLSGSVWTLFVSELIRFRVNRRYRTNFVRSRIRPVSCERSLRVQFFLYTLYI